MRRNQVEERTQSDFIEWAWDMGEAGRWPKATITIPRRVRLGRRTIEIMVPSLAFVHVPNGGNRSPITGARLNAIGTRRGFLDLILPVPMGGHVGLVLELKAPGKYLTKDQKNWIAFLESVGWKTETCRSVSDCINATTSYLDETSSKIML